jgi:hypothetical protein
MSLARPTTRTGKGGPQVKKQARTAASATGVLVLRCPRVEEDGLLTIAIDHRSVRPEMDAERLEFLGGRRPSSGG